MPNSRATSVCSRPLVSQSATASRLNSSVNSRRVAPILHLLAQQSVSYRRAVDVTGVGSPEVATVIPCWPVWRGSMGRALPIREDVATTWELRRLAKKEPRRRTAQRMLAIANALEGMSRADAARAVGIERQSLRDAVIRFNAEGLAGLVDR